MRWACVGSRMRTPRGRGQGTESFEGLVAAGGRPRRAPEEAVPDGFKAEAAGQLLCLCAVCVAGRHREAREVVERLPEKIEILERDDDGPLKAALARETRYRPL